MSDTTDGSRIYPTAYAPRAADHYRGGGAAFGAFLVLLGGMFLYARLSSAVPLWTLWPLAIVAAGIVQLLVPNRRIGWGVEHVADGFGTVLLGMILLGNTMGYVGWEMWFTALTLWPVLLVAAGIGLLGRAAGQAWIRALAPALIWTALISAASTAWTGGAFPLAVLAELGIR